VSVCLSYFASLLVVCQQKVQYALKEHASTVRDPVFLEPLNPTAPTSKTRQKLESVAAMWKKIYTDPELYKYDCFAYWYCI